MNEIKGFYNAAIHPDKIVLYYESLNKSRRVHRLVGALAGPLPSSVEVPAVFKKNHHHGKISPIALKKISRAISYLTYLVPSKRRFHTPDGRSGNYFLSFITLTLSSKQIHSDNEIKRTILHPFLNELCKRFKVRSYIWRLERQKNGNLHFHVITDRFIWWNDLRNSWNYFQERLGYVSHYRLSMSEYHKNGFSYREDISRSWPLSKQLSAWREGVRTDWNSPNSTDVHCIASLGNVAAYITKYITKSTDNSDIEGRLWGCSVNLSGIRGSVEFADGQISEDLKKLMESTQVTIFKSDYFTVIFFKWGLLERLGLLVILDNWNYYLKVRFPEYRPPNLFDQKLVA